MLLEIKKLVGKMSCSESDRRPASSSSPSEGSSSSSGGGSPFPSYSSEASSSAYSSSSLRIGGGLTYHEISEEKEASGSRFGMGSKPSSDGGKRPPKLERQNTFTVDKGEEFIPEGSRTRNQSALLNSTLHTGGIRAILELSLIHI